MVFYMQTAVRPTINAIYGGMCMKKIIAIVMTLVMVLMPTISAFGEEPDLQKLTARSSVGDFDAAFPTDFQYRSEYEDEFGNNGYIQFSIIGDNSYVEVYVNGELTQRAYSSSKDNIVLWQEYGTSEQRMHDKSEDLKSDLYTDYISDDVSMDKNPEVSVQSDFISFDPEGWSYITTRPSNPTITGSRPCAIYYRNYDDEPDQNRYSGKKVSFNAGTAVGVIVSVLSVFLTGGVTVSAIVVAMGSAIVADAISQSITGNVCFSTQKIRYAPVIGGKLIFKDAYITKRWVVISDTVHRTETIKLDDPEYAYNRGHDIYAIAKNAQQEDVNYRA